MIIFTILGIITTIAFFLICIMAIMEGKGKRKINEKVIWNMDKLEPLTDSDLIDEIQSNER